MDDYESRPFPKTTDHKQIYPKHSRKYCQSNKIISRHKFHRSLIKIALRWSQTHIYFKAMNMLTSKQTLILTTSNEKLESKNSNAISGFVCQFNQFGDNGKKNMYKYLV